jgi:hypothetical protein
MPWPLHATLLLLHSKLRADDDGSDDDGRGVSAQGAPPKEEGFLCLFSPVNPRPRSVENTP